MKPAQSYRFGHPGRIVLLLLLATVMPSVSAQNLPAYELPPINYSKAVTTNRVTAFKARLAAEPTLLASDSEQVRLRTALAAFGVAEESQVLLFSKTSLQRRLITPKTPRSLYFSEDVYLGWVPGGLMELTVTDPALGLVFYRFDARSPDRPPVIERDEECLSCHAGPLTRDWPALMVRSVFPGETGEPIGPAGSFLIEHDTVISNRWGGWYVTGSSGGEPHLGNLLLADYQPNVAVQRAATTSDTDLAAFFPTDRYLRPDSDIVALMVFEHQVGMHNRLAEGALQVRKWTHYQRELQRELGETVSEEPVGTALRVVQGEAGRILEHLLFVGEAALPEGGIQGNAAFQEAFRRNRRPDSQDRSLKDLDLANRLFRWRCSYMIYSAAFASLPNSLRTEVLGRLRQGLMSEEPPRPFSHLPATERQAIHEILLATHEGYADMANTAPESGQ